jgi:hypothetical protein
MKVGRQPKFVRKMLSEKASYEDSVGKAHQENSYVDNTACLTCRAESFA